MCMMRNMKQDPHDLLKVTLKLPPEARVALAGFLFDSLDREVDEDAETAWHAEIDRQLKNLDSGKVKPIPWSEVCRKIASC